MGYLGHPTEPSRSLRVSIHLSGWSPGGLSSAGVQGNMRAPTQREVHPPTHAITPSASACNCPRGTMPCVPMNTGHNCSDRSVPKTGRGPSWMHRRVKSKVNQALPAKKGPWRPCSPAGKSVHPSLSHLQSWPVPQDLAYPECSAEDT